LGILKVLRVAKLQYAGSSLIEGCWNALHVLQSAKKLFAGRYGKTRTSISRGRSVMEVVVSDIVKFYLKFEICICILEKDETILCKQVYVSQLVVGNYDAGQVRGSLSRIIADIALG
jgi:hypothetical protein